MKNPPMVFARQANIANGPQQVNNGTVPLAERTNSRPRQTVAEPNKLSGANHELPQDTGASPATSGANPDLAAVGAVNRAPDC